MPCPQDFAKLSVEVYAGTVPEGWRDLGIPLPEGAKTSGFYALAYQNIRTNDIVIYYRGTEGISDPGDLLADAAIATGGWHQQFLDALTFANTVRLDPRFENSTISVTGHSLGGALAQLASDVFGWGGMTFDAPGAYEITQGENAAEFASFFEANPSLDGFGHSGPQLANLRVSGSVISSRGTLIGAEPQVVEPGAGGVGVVDVMVPGFASNMPKRGRQVWRRPVSTTEGPPWIHARPENIREMTSVLWNGIPSKRPVHPEGVRAAN